jgi:hypothetical protein
MTRRRRYGALRSFLREHSLSLVVGVILGVLWVGYARSSPQTHSGDFLGNAVADWLGVLVFVIGTKYFFEVGSAESRKPTHLHQRLGRLFEEHSLTIVLGLSGVLWLAAYARSDVESRSGQLLGNILSDWTQLLGLVIITKYTRERGSKEGH